MDILSRSSQFSSETGDFLSDSSNIITSGEQVLYDLLFTDDLDQSQSSSSDYKRQTLDESYAYLQELNSYHIDRLQNEPAVLLESKQHIHEEIKNLAFCNYKTFIRTAQCSREIYSDFSIIESKLDQLITKLPEFGSVCENFTKNIQNINASRRTNNLTLQKHNQLLELLEISQLMDTCVRNEYYEEALDLAAYVKRFEKKFSNSIQIIQQISDDVNKSLNMMLKQLLQLLKTNLQFNQCLKIIGIIRRLEVFTESELRIKFLQLRDSWLQSLLQNIPQADPYHHISKTIEENRIHLFDIITQYRAIFSDDDIISTAASSAQQIPQSQLTASFLLNQKEFNESRLFYCWLQQKIKDFLEVLKKDLKLGVGNRLDSVLSQSMYFGLAFSRVGLDFRVLMVPIFEEAVYEQMNKALDNSNSKFEESLSKLNWSELYLESSKLTSTDYLSDSKNNTKISGSQSLIVNPPISLLEFQPLAIYLNIILQSFNELRLCAPLSLHSKLTDRLRQSIRNLSIYLENYYKKEKANLDTNERGLFTGFLGQLAYQLIPFLERCLLIMFPIDQLQKVFGVSQVDLDKLKNSLKLNPKELLSNISDLLPEPKQEPVLIQNDNNNLIKEEKSDVVESSSNLNEIPEESAQLETVESNLAENEPPIEQAHPDASNETKNPDEVIEKDDSEQDKPQTEIA